MDTRLERIRLVFEIANKALTPKSYTWKNIAERMYEIAQEQIKVDDELAGEIIFQSLLDSSLPIKEQKKVFRERIEHYNNILKYLKGRNK